MIFFCYNKGTKRKKQTKNVSIFQKRGQTNEQIKHSPNERRGLAKGRRDTAKEYEKGGYEKR